MRDFRVGGCHGLGEGVVLAFGASLGGAKGLPILARVKGLCEGRLRGGRNELDWPPAFSHHIGTGALQLAGHVTPVSRNFGEL